MKPRSGIVVSSALHGGVLLWALVGFSSAAPYQVEPTPALPVEFITPSEFDKLAKGERHSKTVDKPKVEAKKIAAATPEPKPAAPEAKQNIDAPPPPPEKAETPPPPKEQPKKEEPKKAEAKPLPPAPSPKPADLPKPPEKKVDDQSQARLDEMIKKEVEKKPDPPKKVEKKTPEKPKPQFDINKIAALADRRDPGRVAQSAPELSNITTAGISNGTAPQLSLSEKSMINQMVIDQVKRCWAPPVGAAGAQDLAVIVEFRLGQDGSLTGTPEVMNSSGHPQFQAAADSAVRAVRRCSPLQLPPQYYDHWKNVQINFDPRDMMGG